MTIIHLLSLMMASLLASWQEIFAKTSHFLIHNRSVTFCQITGEGCGTGYELVTVVKLLGTVSR